MMMCVVGMYVGVQCTCGVCVDHACVFVLFSIVCRYVGVCGVLSIIVDCVH